MKHGDSLNHQKLGNHGDLRMKNGDLTMNNGMIDNQTKIWGWRIETNKFLQYEELIYVYLGIAQKR